MITFDNLYDVYLETRANKRRSDDSIDYEIHYERNLLQLKDAIDNHSLRPSAYTFIANYPRPREVFACDFNSRLCHHYIARVTAPAMEKRMTSRSFNNRKGYGPLEAVNQLMEDIYEVSQGYTRDCWIIGCDIEGYFPNISQDIAYVQQLDLLKDYHGADRDELLYMLQASIYANPAEHCYRKTGIEQWAAKIVPKKSLMTKPEGIGGAIGFLIWQMALNYYLNDIDKKMVDTYGLHYVRYVDDMRWVVEDKEAFLTLLPELRKDLAKLHCTLHPRKFTCQHYSKGTTFIGYHIKPYRVHRDNRVLRSALIKVHQLNHHPRPAQIEKFLCTVNSYIGMLKCCNDYKKVMRIVDAVNPKWLTFVHFDRKRLCYNANPGYTHKELLAKKYGVKMRKLQRPPKGGNSYKGRNHIDNNYDTKRTISARREQKT